MTEPVIIAVEGKITIDDSEFKQKAKNTEEKLSSLDKLLKSLEKVKIAINFDGTALTSAMTQMKQMEDRIKTLENKQIKFGFDVTGVNQATYAFKGLETAGTQAGQAISNSFKQAGDNAVKSTTESMEKVKQAHAKAAKDIADAQVKSTSTKFETDKALADYKAFTSLRIAAIKSGEIATSALYEEEANKAIAKLEDTNRKKLAIIRANNAVFVANEKLGLVEVSKLHEEANREMIIAQNEANKRAIANSKANVSNLIAETKNQQALQLESYKRQLELESVALKVNLTERANEYRKNADIIKALMNNSQKELVRDLVAIRNTLGSSFNNLKLTGLEFNKTPIVNQLKELNSLISTETQKSLNELKADRDIAHKQELADLRASANQKIQIIQETNRLIAGMQQSSNFKFGSQVQPDIQRGNVLASNRMVQGMTESGNIAKSSSLQTQLQDLRNSLKQAEALTAASHVEQLAQYKSFLQLRNVADRKGNEERKAHYQAEADFIRNTQTVAYNSVISLINTQLLQLRQLHSEQTNDVAVRQINREIEALERRNSVLARQNTSFATAQVRGDTGLRQNELVAQTSTVNGLTGALNKLQQTLMLVGVALSGRQIMEYADQWLHFVNAVAISTEKTGNAAAMQEKIFDLAQNARAPLDAVSSVYLRMSRAAETLNITQGETVKTIDTVVKALAIMGTSPNQVRGGLLQLEQALGGVVVRGQEFKSIQDSMPALMSVVVKHYDEAKKAIDLENAAMRGASETELEQIKGRKQTIFTLADLRKEMYAGRLESLVMQRAMVLGNDEISETFDNTHKTYAQAFKTIENGFIKWVGGLNQATQASDKFYQASKYIADNMNVVIGLLGAAAAGVLGYGATFATLAISLNPIGVAVATVASLTAGFVLLKDEIKVTENGLATWGDVFDVITDRLGRSIDDWKNKFIDFKKWVEENKGENKYIRNVSDLADRSSEFVGAWADWMVGEPSKKAEVMAQKRKFMNYPSVDYASELFSKQLGATGTLTSPFAAKTRVDKALDIAITPSSLDKGNVGFNLDTEEGRNQLKAYEAEQRKIYEAQIQNQGAIEQGIYKTTKRYEEQIKSMTDGSKYQAIYNDELTNSFNELGTDAKKQYRDIYDWEKKLSVEEKQRIENKANLIAKEFQQAETTKKINEETKRQEEQFPARYQAMTDAIKGMEQEYLNLQKQLDAKPIKLTVDHQDFVSKLSQFKPAAEKLGIDPKMLLSQSAIETGWGKHIIGNNMFNIKADKSWKGETVSVMSREEINGESKMVRSNFRKYNSVEDSVNDFVNFIFQNPRYKTAVDVAKRGDSVGFISELQKAGYATDSNYAKSITSAYKGKTIEAADNEILTKISEVENRITEAKKAQAAFAEKHTDENRKAFDHATRAYNLSKEEVANARELAEIQARANLKQAKREEGYRQIENQFYGRDEINAAKLQTTDYIQRMLTEKGAGALPVFEQERKQAEARIPEIDKQLADLKETAQITDDLIGMGYDTTDLKLRHIELENQINELYKERAILQNKDTQLLDTAAQKAKDYGDAARAFNDKMKVNADEGGFFKKGETVKQAQAEALREGVDFKSDRYKEIYKMQSEDNFRKFADDLAQSTVDILSNSLKSAFDKIRKGESFGSAMGDAATSALSQGLDNLFSKSKDMMMKKMNDIFGEGGSGDIGEMFSSKEGQLAMAGMAVSIGTMIAQSAYSKEGKDNTRPATLATGTVLGTNEVSHSVDNVGKILQEIHYKEYPELRSMGKNFKDLSSSIDDFIASVAKSTSNFGNLVDIPTPNVNLAGDKIMNAVAGAIVGGGALLGGLMGFMGTKATVERIGEGIILNATTLVMDATEQAMVTGSTFAKDKITRSGFLGTKTKIVETLGELSSEFTSSFNKVLLATADTIWGLGKDLKLEKILGDRLTTIRTPSVKWDTLDAKKSGTSGQFMKDQINAYLDRIAESVFGNLLGRFQKLGEGMLETVGRLRVGVAVAFGGLDKLGIKIRSMFDESPMGAIEFSNAMAELWDSTGNAKDGVKNLATALNAFYDITTSQGGKLTDSYTKITSLIATIGAKYPEAVRSDLSASNITGEDLRGFLTPVTKDFAKTSVQLGEVSKLMKPAGEFENPSSVTGKLSDVVSGSTATLPNWESFLRAAGIDNTEAKSLDNAKFSQLSDIWQTWFNDLASTTDDKWIAVRDFLKENDKVVAEAAAELAGTEITSTKDVQAKMEPIETIQKKQADLQAMVLASQEAYAAILENRNTILNTEVDILKGNLTLNQQLQYAIKKDLGVRDAVKNADGTISLKDSYSFSTYNTTEDVRNSANFALDKSTLSEYDKMITSLSTPEGNKKYTDILGADAVGYLQNIAPVIKSSIEKTIANLKDQLGRETDPETISILNKQIEKFEKNLKDVGVNGIPVTTQSLQLLAKATEVIRKDTDAHTQSLFNQSQLITDGRLTTEYEKRQNSFNKELAEMTKLHGVNSQYVKDLQDEFTNKETAAFLQDKEASALKLRLALAPESERFAIQYQEDVKAINNKWKEGSDAAKELIGTLDETRAAMQQSNYESKSLDNLRQLSSLDMTPAQKAFYDLQNTLTDIPKTADLSAEAIMNLRDQATELYNKATKVKFDDAFDAASLELFNVTATESQRAANDLSLKIKQIDKTFRDGNVTYMMTEVANEFGELEIVMVEVASEGDKYADSLTDLARKTYEATKKLKEANSLIEAKTYLKDFGQSIKDWVNNLRSTQLGSTKSQLDVSAGLFQKKMSAYQNPFLSPEEKRKELTGITGVAATYINAIKNYYGASKEGIDLINEVVSSVEAIPEQLSIQEMQLNRLDKIYDINKETKEILSSFGINVSNAVYEPLTKAIDELKKVSSVTPTTDEGLLAQAQMRTNLNTAITGLVNVMDESKSIQTPTIQMAEQAIATGTAVYNSTFTDAQKVQMLTDLDSGLVAAGSVIGFFKGLPNPTEADLKAMKESAGSFVSILKTLKDNVGDKNFPIVLEATLSTLSTSLTNVNTNLPKVATIMSGFDAILTTWSAINLVSTKEDEVTKSTNSDKAAAFVLGFDASIQDVVKNYKVSAEDKTTALANFSTAANNALDLVVSAAGGLKPADTFANDKNTVYGINAGNAVNKVIGAVAALTLPEGTASENSKNFTKSASDKFTEITSAISGATFDKKTFSTQVFDDKDKGILGVATAKFFTIAGEVGKQSVSSTDVEGMASGLLGSVTKSKGQITKVGAAGFLATVASALGNTALSDDEKLSLTGKIYDGTQTFIDKAKDTIGSAGASVDVTTVTDSLLAGFEKYYADAAGLVKLDDTVSIKTGLTSLTNALNDVLTETGKQVAALNAQAAANFAAAGDTGSGTISGGNTTGSGTGTSAISGGVAGNITPKISFPSPATSAIGGTTVAGHKGVYSDYTLALYEKYKDKGYKLPEDLIGGTPATQQNQNQIIGKQLIGTELKSKYPDNYAQIVNYLMIKAGGSDESKVKISYIQDTIGIGLDDIVKASYDNKPIAGTYWNQLPYTIMPKFATGGAFTNGIVDRPTAFNMGLMGEAGSEAIMPLTNVNGKLGVYAANDGNTNRDEEIAELKAQNQNMQKQIQIMVAQNQILQAGFQALVNENQAQNDSLRSIKQTNKEVAYG